MGDGKPPKEVSVTDPLATWVARPGVDPFFASDANHLIDNKAGSSSTPRAAPIALKPSSGSTAFDCEA